MRILLTGVGGPAAISVWKSLKDEHELYMADIDPLAAGLYLVPAMQRFIVPRGDTNAFVPFILDLCQKHKIELVIATVDSELAPLAKALPQFTAAGIRVPLCPYDVLLLCRDKHALLTYCLEQHVLTDAIPDFVLLTEETLHTIIDFPRFAKPCLGAGSSGIKLINNATELAALPLDGSYLIQELLSGIEYSVDTYIDSHGHPIAAVPRVRMKIDSGVAVTTRTEQFPELMQKAVNLAQALGVRYVANIQFKADINGKYKLLEINPRFSGALPLTIEAGVDIPKLLIKDIQGEPLPTGLMPFKDLMVVRYWTEHFCSPAEWRALCQA